MTIRAYCGTIEAPQVASSGLVINFWTRMDGVPDNGDGITVPFGSTAAEIADAMRIKRKEVLDPFLQDPLTVAEIEVL